MIKRTNKIKNTEVLEVTNKKVNHSFTHLLNHLFTSKKGFTLAEILITIVIIGVVAVMTIPTLVGEIQTKSWDSASKNFETKFEQALKIMNSQGTLAYHKSTEDFIEELGKNFKIANVCKDNPSDCFEDTMFWGEQTLDMTQVKDNKSFGMKSWPDSEAIGLQFANGVTAILAYNKGCKQNQFSNETNVFDCISMVYDTTAKADPNENTKDIRTINVNRLLNAGCVATTPDGICVIKTAFKPIALDCTKAENSKYCIRDKGTSTHTTDYWAGGTKTCEEAGGRLPDESILAKIASDVYGLEIGATESKSGLTTFNSTKAQQYGINEGDYIWSSNEVYYNTVSCYGYYRTFAKNNSTRFNENGGRRDNTTTKVICVE